VSVIGLSSGAPWRRRLERSVAYVALTAMLLAPSLWWIQLYSGLTEYVRNGLEMSRNEAERTEIGWPRFRLDGVPSPFALFEHEGNAAAWIYYLYLGVPLLVIGITAWRWRRRSDPDARLGSFVALSLMTLMLAQYFLRGNLGTRLGDMGPPMAVLGAYLLSRAISRRRAWPRTILPGSLAVAVLAVTVVCTWSVASVGRELGTARLVERHVFARARQISQELAAMPRSLREGQAADRMQAADYLHRCTRPTDRVIVVGYYADVPAFSERLFAGGRVTFVVDSYVDERYMRETIAKLESQSVPIVLGGAEVDYSEFRLLREYLLGRYKEVGTVTFDDGSLSVWVRRGLTGTETGPNGLPCFG
jgi:nitrate reductase gamma subunit